MDGQRRAGAVLPQQECPRGILPRNARASADARIGKQPAQADNHHDAWDGPRGSRG